MASQCLGQNRNGGPCSGTPGADGYCMWHSPARQVEREEWRRRGGQRRSNASRARKAMADGALSPAEIEGVLGLTMKAVLNGSKDPAIGNAIANLARAAVAVREAVAVDERLGELERKIGSHAS